MHRARSRPNGCTASNAGAGPQRRWSAHVRYSPLIRTYSALRSHVHTVASPAPPVPRSTWTSISSRCQQLRRLGRVVVERLPVLEEHHLARPRTSARSITKRAPRAARTPRPAGPSSDRRRARPSSPAASWRWSSPRASRRRWTPRRSRASATSFVAPSPPRTMAMASVRATASSPATSAGYSSSSIVGVAGPAGERDQRVVGRALAVHRDRVECPARHFSKRPVQQRRLDLSRPSSRRRASSPSSARSCRRPWRCRRRGTRPSASPPGPRAPSARGPSS